MDVIRAAGLLLGSTLIMTAEIVAATTIKLPAPAWSGRIPVAEALQSRRSIREFERSPLTAQELSQLLWAAQGITTSDGRRTAPSAGALYPLEIYVVVGNVTSIPAGVYHYIPRSHQIESIALEDRRAMLARAALGQESVANAAAVMVIAAVYARTAAKYGGRAERYVNIEAGCAAENLALLAVAMNLGSVVVGAFDDQSVRRITGLAASESPLILMPVGHPRRQEHSDE